jgi:hypothetical protein
MISLIAAAFDDGWAFVRQGYTVYLVRPPYQRRGLVEVSESAALRAVHAHGFTPELRDFRDWGTLVAFLRGKIVEAAEARAPRLEEVDASARLLRHAPLDVIAGYLDRIERELLPGGEHRAALRLLTALYGLEQVALDPVLRSRTASLLDASVEAASASIERRSALLDDEKDLRRRFPRAMEQFGEELTGFMRSVRQRGSLLAMGE